MGAKGSTPSEIKLEAVVPKANEEKSSGAQQDLLVPFDSRLGRVVILDGQTLKVSGRSVLNNGAFIGFTNPRKKSKDKDEQRKKKIRVSPASNFGNSIKSARSAFEFKTKKTKIKFAFRKCESF